ncbi:50S ribosome-binding GTPase [Candidatus Woesearchaeota archaeon]|nr:50S ribosome-binding GTPase [Candidatus Woesearchaeota archaeon]
MNFQNLTRIETPDTYLDIAFSKAKKTVGKVREKTKLREGAKEARLEKSKKIETERISTIRNILYDRLNEILTSYPSIDRLPIFYRELVKCTLDYAALKKSLGAVNWAAKKVNEFFRLYQSKIAKTRDLEKVNQYRREFYGRISSVVKRIKEELAYLEESRKVMKDYPAVKTSAKTAAIMGFPNVGKTTLLYKLTGSKPEIKSYAFTTKNINISYIETKDKKIQLLDTPGTLNRFNKMNNIEKQAYLALKYCADLIVYVFDITEPFPLKEQEELLRNLKEFKKEVIIYLSKADILEKEKTNEFKKKHKESITKPEELKQKLISSLS